jgi:hypothetical protein
MTKMGDFRLFTGISRLIYMRLLLDTHILLWWLDDYTKLSSEAYKAIENGENEVFVSAAWARNQRLKNTPEKRRKSGKDLWENRKQL